jgi:hypothetical protein
MAVNELTVLGDMSEGEMTVEAGYTALFSDISYTHPDLR